MSESTTAQATPTEDSGVWLIQVVDKDRETSLYSMEDCPAAREINNMLDSVGKDEEPNYVAYPILFELARRTDSYPTTDIHDYSLVNRDAERLVAELPSAECLKDLDDDEACTTVVGKILGFRSVPGHFRTE